MDVEFMSVHVRNKLKLSMNHPRSLEHVIVVDVQVIIRQSVMQELTQMEMTWTNAYVSFGASFD